MKKTLLLPIIIVLALSLQLTGCKKKQSPQIAKITVTVISFETGDKVSGSDVSLHNDEGEIESKTTGSDGKVVFDDLDPGTYYIYAYYEDNDGCYYYGNISVDLKRGDSKSVTIELMEDEL